MNGSADLSLRDPDSCGCGAGRSVLTPVGVDNRPGLAAIAYRVGTHAQFRQSLLAGLSSGALPALAALQTRDPDDFSIALLDAWATVADVLTFYQERIANESYLRTATERRSLLEQARLIGYELRPGVAASTCLAFTLTDAPGSPRRTTIAAGTKIQSVPGQDEEPQTFETVEDLEARVEWNALKPKLSQPVVPRLGSTHVYLKGTSTNLKSGDGLLLVGSEREADPGSERWDFRRVTAVIPDHEADRTRVEWAKGLGATVPHIVPPAARPQVYALRQRASLFGYNAPHPRTLANETLSHYGIDPTKTIGDWPFAFSGHKIDLDSTYPAIRDGQWLVLSSPDYQELYRATAVAEASQANFTLAGKTTRITLDSKENLNRFQDSYRSATVFAQSDLLEPAEQPIAEPITGASIPLAQVPSGLAKGRLLAASGKDASSGQPIGEVVQLTEVSDTTLTVQPPLRHRYVRGSFALNANVARATHGETVTEMLGSGDAGQTFQRFPLRQPPLTFVSAARPSGAASTLRLFVNELEWHEAPTLYGRGPHERVFVTRTGDDGRTTVQFGDGLTGARLPTGLENVRATYRRGLGLAGLLKAGQLSTLLTRPLGVKSVLNPEDAAGAADRQSLADARASAPLTVLTLDRTVSLRDYEDFTRAFAGVAKALATWTGVGRTRGVLLTVAGPRGATIEPAGELAVHLLAALSQAGDPQVSLRVVSFRDVRFKITGGFRVQPDYVPENVKTAVDAALREHFSFAARSFGQPVSLSEVIAVIQAVPGVEMVDVDDVVRTAGGGLVNGRLRAAMPEGDLGAELLTLDPAHLDELKVIS